MIEDVDLTARHTKRIGPKLNHIVVQHAVRMRDRVVELLDRVAELEVAIRLAAEDVEDGDGQERWDRMYALFGMVPDRARR